MPEFNKILAVFRTINSIYRFGWPTIVGMASLLVLSAVLESAGLAMVLPLLDYVQHNGNIQALSEKSKIWLEIRNVSEFLGIAVNLIILSAMIFGVILCRQVVQYVVVVWLGRLRLRTETALRKRVYGSLNRSSSLTASREHHGGMLDLLGYQSVQAAGIPEAIGKLWASAVLILAYALLAVTAAPGPALMAIASLLAGLLALNALVVAMKKVSIKQVGAQKKFNDWASERILGWKLVRLSNAVDREEAKYADLAETVATHGLHIVRIGAVTQMLMISGITGLVLVVLNLSFSWFMIEVGVVTLFVIVMMRLMPVALGLIRVRQNLENRLASLERILSTVRRFESDPELQTGQAELPDILGEIRLDNVVFSYDRDGAAALNGATASIPAGSITALLGPSGAGKSTMADILLGLVRPQQGSVLINGIDIKSYSLKSLRERVAYMPQAPILFNATIAENVSFVRPEAPMSEIERACEKAHVTEFSDLLPDGLRTVVGEGGEGFSGGQKQRIALACAFLSEASLLVLDEPTSTLDPKSEVLVRESLLQVAHEQSVTVVIIAHSRSLAEIADHFIRVEAGKVVYEGNDLGLAAGEIVNDKSDI